MCQNPSFISTIIFFQPNSAEKRDFRCKMISQGAFQRQYMILFTIKNILKSKNYIYIRIKIYKITIL